MMNTVFPVSPMSARNKKLLILLTIIVVAAAVLFFLRAAVYRAFFSLGKSLAGG